jgi:hypothetical protein
MSSQIISSVLGQLTQDKNLKGWWKSNSFEIPFFNKERLTITYTDCEPEEDKTFIIEADKALTNFFKLNSTDRQAISENAYKLCMDFLNEIEFDEADEPFRKISDKNDIWNFIHPTELFVTRRPFKEKDMYVQIACECDWEQEHDLQLVFRQGIKLTRISYFDGHLTEADAYGKPDEEDELLSGFLKTDG